jgi:hypothetical protein
MPSNWLEAPVLSPMMKVKLATVFWVMNSHPTVFSSVGWVFHFYEETPVPVLETNWNWVYSSVGLVYRIRINPWF